MKIIHQFILSTILFCLILIVVLVSAIVTNQQIQALTALERTAREVERQAYELGYLSSDYLLYRENQQLARWEAVFAAFSDDLDRLKVTAPEQRALVGNIRTNQERLRGVFAEVRAAIEGSAPDRIDPALMQLSWSRMAVQTQSIIFNASQLATILDDRENQLRQTRTLLLFMLIGAFGAFLLVTYLLTYRRTLASIARLQAGTAVIGSGNLDFTLEEKKKDEIGDLSRSFNRMTASLKEVTASKVDLEKEIIERKRAESELESVAAQRQLALDAARLGWWHYDPNKRYSWWDERYKEIFGFTEYEKPNDEILATRLHPEDRPGVWAKVEAALNPVNPQPYSAVYRINLPDGSVRWVEAYGTATFEGAGKDKHATSLVGTVADITERKKAEQIIRESEEKYRTLFTNMSSGYAFCRMIFDDKNQPVDFIYLEVNDAFERLTGLKKADVLGKRVTEAIPGIKEQNPEVIPTYGRVVLTGEPAAFEFFFQPLQMWLNIKVSRAKEGHFIAVFDNVTERKRAEARINHLATFPELNPNPIVELDAAGNVRYANPSARRLFPDLPAQGNQHPYLADWKSLVAALESGEKRLSSRDITVGEATFLQTVTFVPDSQTLRIYGREITERRRAEQALEQRSSELEVANKELEAFAYSVSHDLRAPLRSMEGFSAALGEDYADKLDDKGKQYLKYIQDSSELMARLIDDLLKLSRVTRSEMNWERVNISAMAQEIIGSLQRSQPERVVKITIAPDMTAYGDRALLRLVLENLLNNAWKFTSKTGSPAIEVGVTDHNGRRAYFVRDNGVGFDMAYANKLFQPFQRLHKATEFPGTGIGLATVERVIRRHGGEVWAESKVGEGATFYFTLGS